MNTPDKQQRLQELLLELARPETEITDSNLEQHRKCRKKYPISRIKASSVLISYTDRTLSVGREIVRLSRDSIFACISEPHEFIRGSVSILDAIWKTGCLC